MNKSRLTLVLALVAGISLFTVATVAASTSNVGYEKFKTVMEQIEEPEDGRMLGNVVVTDNGATLVEVQFDGVGGKDSDQASGSVSMIAGDTRKAFDFYKGDEDLYLIDQEEEGYYQLVASDEDNDGRHGGHGRGRDYENDDDKMSPVEEEILDYMVGDLKDNFIVNDNGDSTTIAFEMEDEQVPELLNLIVKASSAAEHRGMKGHDESMSDLPFMADVDMDLMSDLIDQVKLDRFAIVATIDDEDVLSNFDMTIEVSGLDANGDFHEVVVVIAMSVEADVAVEVMDVDAYNWEVIEREY